MRRRKSHLKKRHRRSQISAATNNGRFSSITQFCAMPRPQIKDAAFRQSDSLPERYSSRHQMAAASSNWSTITPAAAVSSRQKLNSKPPTAQASSTGSDLIHFLFSSGGQSQDSSSTDRASIPNVKAPPMAKNKFRLT